ncbi:MAG: amidohydrolase family protein [Kineosporiaceae bacterium]
MTEPGAPPVVDVHAHAVLRMSLGAAGTAGPELGVSADGTPFYRVGDYVLEGVRYEGSPFMDVDVRLAAMDAAGIDRQLLSPNPITYFGSLEPSAAVRYARAHNDALAEIVRAHPDRLLGAAQLPMQDLGAAIAEMERATRELGLRAPYIDTDPGRRLDDPAMDDFWAAAVDLDVPVFVHPTPLGSAGPADDPRLRRFDLDLIVGFAYDETLAVAALVFGGVLDRHPRRVVCLSHGGAGADDRGDALGDHRPVPLVVPVGEVGLAVLQVGHHDGVPVARVDPGVEPEGQRAVAGLGALPAPAPDPRFRGGALLGRGLGLPGEDDDVTEHGRTPSQVGGTAPLSRAARAHRRRRR